MLSGWELAFRRHIPVDSADRMAQVQKANWLKAWNVAVFFATNITVSGVIFTMILVLRGDDELTSMKSVFTTFTLINIVQLTMTKFLPFGVMVHSNGIITLYFSFQSFLNDFLPRLYPKLSFLAMGSAISLEEGGDQQMSQSC